MKNSLDLQINDRWILSLRGTKNPVDQQRPYAWLVEKERTRNGNIEDVGIIFLTNRECQYSCLMCDLWKNTTDKSVTPGAISGQIGYALKFMPGIKHLKLYNSGSFFDERAIPVTEYENIASLLKGFENVVVESHPSLIGKKNLLFRKMLKPELEVAIGLETVHTEVLKKLNKKMTLDRFRRAVRYLSDNGVFSRAFILLRPPFLTEEEGIEWAQKSIEFAFLAGVECCTVIPVRGGNGAMENLQENGLFSPPKIHSLEQVVEYGLRLRAGRIFADIWDLGLFSDCPDCFEKRRERLTRINLYQEIQEPVVCSCI